MGCGASQTGFTAGEKNEKRPPKIVISDGKSKNSADLHATMMAAQEGNIGAVEKWIASGGDVNAKDEGERTLLHAAARAGNTNMTEYLLQAGANSSHRDNNGDTPAKLATKYLQHNLATQLLETGAPRRVSLSSQISSPRRLATARRFMNDLVTYARVEGPRVSLYAVYSYMYEMYGLDCSKTTYVGNTILACGKDKEPADNNVYRDPERRSSYSLDSTLDAMKKFCGSTTINVHDLSVFFDNDAPCHLVRELCCSSTSIAQWVNLNKVIQSLMSEVIKETGGDGSDFYLSLCTAQGQQATYGEQLLHLDTVSHLFAYAYCLNMLKPEYVHQYVDQVPNTNENSFVLSEKKIPHNAACTSGAILLMSLMMDLEGYAEFLSRASGGHAFKQDKATYEKLVQDSYKYEAVAHFLASNDCYATKQSVAGVRDVTDAYMQALSLAGDVSSMAIMAATLCNYGACPMTNEKLLSFDTVKALMHVASTNGLGTLSGEWGHTIGLPAFASSTGTLLLIIPGVLGMCIHAPQLAANGHSMMAIPFARKFVYKLGMTTMDILYAASSC